MKITREINGQTVEFELTDNELLDAFFEMQQECDAEDIRDLALDYTEQDFVEAFGVCRSAVFTNAKEIGERLRNYIENCDSWWRTMRDDTVKGWALDQKTSKAQ